LTPRSNARGCRRHDDHRTGNAPGPRHRNGMKRKRILPVDFREPIDYL